MPKPARIPTDYRATGRHATPTRGRALRLAGVTSESEYRRPVSGPTGFVATTGLTKANPGATSRFTRRPNRSVIGASYSHRIPALIVNPGPNLTSSVK